MDLLPFSTRNQGGPDEEQPQYGLLGGGGGGGFGGLLGGMGEKFHDNSNLLAALGMGLMSSPRNNPGENLMQGLATGGTMDARALKAKQDQQQQAQARQAMVIALTKSGMDPNEANLMAASPQAVNTWMQQQQNQKADARDTRDFQFRQTEAQRAQSNADRQFNKPGEYNPENELGRVSPTGQYEVVRPGLTRPKNVQIVEGMDGNKYAVDPNDPTNPKKLNLDAGNPANSDITGEDYLKTLDPNRAGQIKAIKEGRMQPPSSFALKTPYWQAMMRDVGQYEPGFDMTLWKRRNETQADFGKGKMAGDIKSLNTVIGHMDDLLQTGDALNNTNSPLWNRVANAYIDNTGDPRVKAYTITQNAVADEMAKVFRSTGMSDASIKGWKDELSAANSPAQLHGVVRKGLDLMQSRLEAVGDQYNRGMGTSVDPASLLNPRSQEKLASIRKRVNGEGTGEKPSEKPAGGSGTFGNVPYRVLD